MLMGWRGTTLLKGSLCRSSTLPGAALIRTVCEQVGIVTVTISSKASFEWTISTFSFEQKEAGPPDRRPHPC
jgi:hypothetical protein